MKKQEAASLLIKLMALFLLLSSAPAIVQILVKANSAELFIYVVTAIAFIFALISLFLYSDQLASKIIGEGGGGPVVSLSFDECLTLGYNFIGLILIINSVPEILFLLSKYVHAKSWQVQDELFSVGIVILMRLVAGLVLFIRPQVVVMLWKQLQKSLMKEKAEAANQDKEAK